MSVMPVFWKKKCERRVLIKIGGSDNFEHRTLYITEKKSVKNQDFEKHLWNR